VVVCHDCVWCELRVLFEIRRLYSCWEEMKETERRACEGGAQEIYRKYRPTGRHAKRRQLLKRRRFRCLIDNHEYALTTEHMKHMEEIRTNWKHE